MTLRCAILDDYQGVAIRCAPWSDLSPELEVESFRTPMTGEDLVARLAPFDVIVAMRERTRFDAPLLGRLPRLRLLVTTGMVNASIDVADANRKGIIVCGTRSHTHPTPEHTWALLLSLARRIPFEDAALRRGKWQTSLGIDLAGKTIGIVGFGRIGKAVARYAIAFGMSVIAFSRSLTDEKASEHDVRRAASLAELLTVSDVLSLHVPLTPDTRKIIDAAALRAMKPTALLLNTSRSGIIDTTALAEALETGQIGGAAIDVHDTEPLDRANPLLSTPNTVLTPHQGYVTEANYARYYGDAVENIRLWLAGTATRVLTVG